MHFAWINHWFSPNTGGYVHGELYHVQFGPSQDWSAGARFYLDLPDDPFRWRRVSWEDRRRAHRT